MNDTIEDKKYVELSYKITDTKTGDVLVEVEYPIGYVHGSNDILAPAVPKLTLFKCVRLPSRVIHLVSCWRCPKIAYCVSFSK